MIRTCCLLVAAALVGNCCELPPPDNPLMASAFSCAKDKESKSSPLCFVKCYALTTGIATPEGALNKTRLEEIMDELDEGPLKQTVKVFNNKCLKEGTKVNFKEPNCMGVLKIGKCMGPIIKKRCPEMLTAFGLKTR